MALRYYSSRQFGTVHCGALRPRLRRASQALATSTAAAAAQTTADGLSSFGWTASAALVLYGLGFAAHTTLATSTAVHGPRKNEMRSQSGKRTKSATLMMPMAVNRTNATPAQLERAWEAEDDAEFHQVVRSEEKEEDEWPWRRSWWTAMRKEGEQERTIQTKAHREVQRAIARVRELRTMRQSGRINKAGVRTPE